MHVGPGFFYFFTGTTRLPTSKAQSRTSVHYYMLLHFTQRLGNTVHMQVIRFCQRCQCFYVFCRLYPFSLQPPRQFLGPTHSEFLPVISLLYTLTLLLYIAGVVLPNQMMGEVSWGPRKKTIAGLLVTNPPWLLLYDKK